MTITDLRKHTSHPPWQKNAQAGLSNQAPYNSQQNHMAQYQKWQKSNPGKPSNGKPGQDQNQNNSDKPYVSYQSPKGPNWNYDSKKGKKNFKGKKRANQAIFDSGLQLEPIQFANMATIEETPIKQEFLTPPLEFDKDKEGYHSPPPSLASISESSECDSDSGRESPIIIMVTYIF